MSETRSRPLSADEKLAWLRLIRTENVGPITFYRLLDHFGCAAAALAALPEIAQRGGLGKAIKVCSKAAASREMEALVAIGAKLIARDEPDYPPLLAHVEDAPPLISFKGQVHLLRKKAIAVVGARNASVNGRNFARRIAAALGEGGFVVVSGMARGIDSCAHEGALATGTVAVVAGGIDVVYPKENAGLYTEISERGALISEIEPGTKPLARHFPRRNRLISGLSRGVVVVEASPRSGSLITARMALEQGREVFAVPGSPLDPRSRGSNDLIRQGAILCESADDVFRVTNETRHPSLGEGQSLELTTPCATPPSQKEIDSGRSTIDESLDSAPVMVDELIRDCQLSPAVVSLVLLEMELAGRLERHPGNRVSRLPPPISRD
ncbi:MAG: DNA-processing protein DprA [Rhodospirillales bacterium]|jgi:DNA processing protein|nr:DNA-processing protein DprA [Rhodospirillales bacterium]HIJ43278.1 DNA-protecting protein DprA [Rhodospirillaceae bacterium]MDP7215495.1 DNA-processing protein DprA [Rhodospirillales bacterium]HIJ46308.1 DNA-protecting protein DprA [Rhodospirillaceae bacterium]HIJ93116.1 DNA-protecting protein DprA [Rhodospirillaceae bacterium]